MSERPQADAVSHASLNGIYVKAQELDRGHNDQAAPVAVPPGGAGDEAGFRTSDVVTHASDAQSHASDASTHASDASTHASDASPHASDAATHASDESAYSMGE